MLSLLTLLVLCGQGPDTQGTVPEDLPLDAGERALPQRKLFVDVGDPLRSFEVNSDLRHSVGELVGKGSDLLGVGGRVDATILGRIALVGAHALLSNALEVTSHELAHIREGRRYGPFDARFRFVSLTNFGDNFQKHYGYTPTSAQMIANTVAGVNQDEYNAFLILRSRPREITFDSAIAFLIAKWFDVHQNLIAHDLSDGNDVSDIKTYVTLLNGEGIDLTKREHMGQAVLADVLSLPTWAAVGAVVDYAVGRRRTFTIPAFTVGGVEATFPLISYYLTPKGGFYDVTSFVNPRGEGATELSVGTDVDFMGAGRLDRVRFGGRYDHELALRGVSLRVKPFVYVNLARWAGYRGIATGLEVLWQPTRHLGLRAKVQYAVDDVIENGVKGEANGVGALVSVVVR